MAELNSTIVRGNLRVTDDENVNGNLKVNGTITGNGSGLTNVAWGNISGKPSSLPASDVYEWAKAATKPSYTKSEVGLGNVDNTADADKSVNYANSAGAIAWNNVTGKPDSYPPSSHDHNYLPLGGGTVTGELIMSANRLWIQGGSAAGSNSNRLTTSSGMPGDMQYNNGKRGLQLYSNGIAIADPYNGSTNNDSAWIRHLETTANAGLLEIATGDDASNEEIRFRYYNTSNNIAYDILVPKKTGTMALTSDIPDDTWRPVVDNLTSTATDQSLSANQGKVLKDLVDSKVNLTDLIPETHAYPVFKSGDQNTESSADNKAFLIVDQSLLSGPNADDRLEIKGFTGTYGDDTTPVYFSGGLLTQGQKYAGGTRLNINGTSYTSSATIYAPTSAGSTAGHHLYWTGSAISYTAKTYKNYATANSTNYYIAGWEHSTNNTANGNYTLSQMGTSVYMKGGTTNGGLYAYAFYAASDKRLKENIKDLDLNCLDLINNINLREFSWKNDNEHKPTVGVIAQELRQVLPEKYVHEFIGGQETKDEYLSVNDSKLVYLLIGAIQEQQKEIESLKAKIDSKIV